METEQYETRHIPANFESGINLVGMSFNIRFLVEGTVIALAGGIGTYIYAASIEIGDKATLIGIALAIGVLLLVFGLKGINDEPISQFLINLIRFSKDKRTAYYNPRIKAEAISSINDEIISSTKDSIAAMIEKLKGKMQEIAAKRALYLTENEKKDEIIIFEDDLKLQEQSKATKERKLHAEKQGK